MASLNHVLDTFGKMKGRVTYLLGAKARADALPQDIKRIDCSGLSKYLVPALPHGSQVQLGYARKNLRKLAKYSDVTFAEDDPSRIFIAFLSPSPGNAWPRHVWFVHQGKTIESCSSLGVSSRPWNHPSLKNCKECFELILD